MPVVAILVRLLVPTHFLMDGWRWVMVIGSLGSALAWYFRRSLPESPRWLESRGRHAEAEQALAQLGTESKRLACEKQERRRCAEPKNVAAAEVAERASFAELWRPPYRRRTIMLMIFHALQTIGYYGFANWAPTFLLRRGVSLLHSLEYTLLIALVSPLGPALAVLTSDKLETEVDASWRWRC